MFLKKIFVAAVLVPALVTPALASSRAVRPAVKAVAQAPAAQDRNLTVRSSTRTGAELESSNALLGLPFLFLLAGIAAVAAVVVVVADEESSPS